MSSEVYSIRYRPPQKPIALHRGVPIIVDPAVNLQRLAASPIETVQQVHHDDETLAVHGLDPDIIRVTSEDRGVDRSSVLPVASLGVAERHKVNVDTLVLNHLGERCGFTDRCSVVVDVAGMRDLESSTGVWGIEGPLWC
jgi:hypothetical protein